MCYAHTLSSLRTVPRVSYDEKVHHVLPCSGSRASARSLRRGHALARVVKPFLTLGMKGWDRDFLLEHQKWV